MFKNFSYIIASDKKSATLKIEIVGKKCGETDITGDLSSIGEESKTTHISVEPELILPVSNASFVNDYDCNIYISGEDYICVKDINDDNKYEFNICVLLNASTEELSNLRSYAFNIPLNERAIPKVINTNNSIVCFVFPCSFKNGFISEVSNVNYEGKVTKLTYKLNLLIFI